LAAAFPQLEILEFIGQGGMGFVFKARQPKLDRFVALKILPQSLAADPAFAARFTREGRALARLNHPHIVSIHDFGEASGFFYLLMEFVDGVNLRQAMKVGRFTPAQALAIVPQICEALHFAHQAGVLHRDIKPENILLDTKGRVKIADFGIAKLMEDREPGIAAMTAAPGSLTETGRSLGTPQYMAPEQIEHPQDVDQRADIYSLGVVFYEMLTGELPIGRFAPPSEKSAADPRVDDIVLRALEKQKERRQQNAGEVKAQIETITGASRDPERARPKESPSPHDTSKPALFPIRGWRAALGLVAGLFVVVGCLAAWRMARGFPRRDYILDLAMLLIPMGVGLWRRRPWWRVWALVMLWALSGLTIAVGCLAVIGVVSAPDVWTCLLFVPLPLGMIWVLMRPGVKRLFQRGLLARPWIEWAALAAVALLMVGIEQALLAAGLERMNSVLTASSFGPPVECVVEVDHPERAFFSLNAGEYVKPPPAVDPADWRSLRLNQWLAAGANADVMATLDHGEPRLALCEMASCRPVADEAWNRPWLLNDVEVQVLTNWSMARPPGQEGPVIVLGGAEPPTTWVFQSRHGLAGLLQVLRLTDNPPKVKFRYKCLLPKVAAPHASVVGGPAPALAVRQWLNVQAPLSLAELK
jgi:tRNA A-37 threonylcarbamoyl transferase component Bud32